MSSSEKFAVTMRAIGKAALYGLAAGAGLSLVAFLFAFLTGGFDAALGLEWARKFLYVVAAVCVIVSGGGLFFAGSPRRDESIGFKKDETLSAFERIGGISWPWALLAASAAMFVLGVALDLVAAVA